MDITAEGHAGYGERGSDIVCAGVSALLFALKAYLYDEAKARGVDQVDCELRDGYLRVRCQGMTACDASALAVTEAGLRQIARSYPRHVHIALSDQKEENENG